MANPNKLFPLIVTDKLAQTRAFYVDTLGCEVAIETPDYLQVRFADEAGPELAFMSTSATTGMGPAQPPFQGAGLIVSIPTTNADKRHAALKAKNTTLASKPSDKPWGWRSFAAVDPNGVLLDFFHVLDQAAAADATG